MAELHTATIIDDADLADDVEFAVRLAATPGLLRGTFAKLRTFFFDVYGVFDFSTPPADGDTLVWDDAANTWVPAPPGGGGGGGGLVLLEQHTAAASATLDFTACISATYDEYIIEIVGLVPATDGQNFLMRMSTNGGSTYDASGIYSWAAQSSNRFGQANSGNDGTATAIQMNHSALDNIATHGINGTIRLFSPGSTTLYTSIRGMDAHLASDGTTIESGNSSGFYRSLTAVDAFRFLMTAGNFASGTIRVYGVEK